MATNGNGVREILAAIKLSVDQGNAIRAEILAIGRDIHELRDDFRQDMRKIAAGTTLVLEEIRELKIEAAADRKKADEDRRAIRSLLERSIEQAAQDRERAAEERKETRKAITRVGRAIIQSLKRIERKLDARGNGRHH